MLIVDWREIVQNVADLGRNGPHFNLSRYPGCNDQVRRVESAGRNSSAYAFLRAWLRTRGQADP